MYTFSRGEQAAMPGFLRTLGCEVPHVIRTASFKYVSVVREVLAARLYEFESEGVPTEIYNAIKFKPSAPGWSQHSGLFGSVVRFCCYCYLARLGGEDVPGASVNDELINREVNALQNNFGIEW